MKKQIADFYEVDVRSIERLKKHEPSENVPEGYVQIFFKTGKYWNYVGEEYDIDEIAKMISDFYKQLPEPTGEEVSRFELMEVDSAK